MPIPRSDHTDELDVTLTHTISSATATATSSSNLSKSVSDKLRPQLLPRRVQYHFCKGVPSHTGAYHDAVVVLPELSKGEIFFTLRHLNSTAKQVLGAEFPEIRNHLLVHGLQDGDFGWTIDILYQLQLLVDVIVEVRWVSM